MNNSSNQISKTVSAEFVATKQRLRSAADDLETIASRHCDGLLVLDELGQMDPNVAGETAYMLANESGKSQETGTGGSTAHKTWRTLVLSAGEISLSDYLKEKAGNS